MPEIAAPAIALAEGGKIRRSWSTDSIADIDNPFFDGESDNRDTGAHAPKPLCLLGVDGTRVPKHRAVSPASVPCLFDAAQRTRARLYTAKISRAPYLLLTQSTQ